VYIKISLHGEVDSYKSRSNPIFIFMWQHTLFSHLMFTCSFNELWWQLKQMKQVFREVFSTSQMHPACRAIITVFCNMLRFSRSVCICACNYIHKALFVLAKRSEILMKSRSDHIWEAVDAVVMCNLSLPRHTRTMHTEFGDCLE